MTPSKSSITLEPIQLGAFSKKQGAKAKIVAPISQTISNTIFFSIYVMHTAALNLIHHLDKSTAREWNSICSIIFYILFIWNFTARSYSCFTELSCAYKKVLSIFLMGGTGKDTVSIIIWYNCVDFYWNSYQLWPKKGTIFLYQTYE